MAYENYFIKCQIPQAIKQRVDHVMELSYPDHNRWFTDNVYPFYKDLYMKVAFEYLNGADSNGNFNPVTIKKPTENDFDLKKNIAIYWLLRPLKSEIPGFCKTWGIKPIATGYEPTISMVSDRIQKFKTHLELKPRQRYSQKLMGEWNEKINSWQPDNVQDQALYKLFSQAVPSLRTLAPTIIAKAIFESFENWTNHYLQA